MIKILIATPLSAPDIGGPATYTALLLKHIDAHNIGAVVVSFRDVRKYPKFIRHIIYVARLLIWARSADVIYALDTVSVGVPACIVAVLTRKPLLLRVPGDYAWEQGRQRFGITANLDDFLISKNHPWQVRVLAWLQTWVARHAAHTIVPSEYLKRVVMAWGIPEDQITRIYSALKVIEVGEAREQLRKMFGYEGLVIATAARLVPWKGVSELIDALTLVRAEGIPARLEIYGEGPEYSRLMERVRERTLDAWVTFHGSLSREELGRRLTASDMFVLNTGYEGLSHQLLEVMHLGVPIVTTKAGGNTELIEDGTEGLLVAVNDVRAIAAAIAQLSADPHLRESLADKARERSRVFHEDVVFQEFISLLNSRVWT